MTNNNEYGVNETFRWEDNLKIKSAQELLAITDPEKAQEAMLQWVERYSDSEISRLWETNQNWPGTTKRPLAKLGHLQGF